MEDLVLERMIPRYVGYHDSSCAPHTCGSETYGERTVCHYELESIVSSKNGYIITNAVPIPVFSGDLLFRYPGMRVEGIGIYHSVFVEFDLNERAEESKALEMVPYVFHNREWGGMGEEDWDGCLHLLADASDSQILLWRAEIFRLLAWMLREAEQNGERIQYENRQIKKIRSALIFVQEHFAERITVGQLAVLSGYSTYYFCRLFKDITQLSPIQYLVRYRIQRAAEYLAATDEAAERIMEMVGFENYGYFWRTFRKIYGVSPREYRDQHGRERGEL